MRLGLDARYLSHGLVGGVHTYVAHLLPALFAQATGQEIFLYADTKRPLDIPVPESVTVRYLPYHNGLSSFVQDWKTLRTAMAADRIDVAHFPANYGFGPRGARTLITVHDEINLLPLTEIWRGHRKDPRTVAMMTYLHFSTRAAVRPNLANTSPVERAVMTRPQTDSATTRRFAASLSGYIAP